MQRWGGVKAFVATPLGRVALIGLGVVTLAASFLYLGPFIAIPTLLVFGLAVPIILGLKRPRHLAVAGLAILLIAAPVTSVFYTQELRTPSGPVSSSPILPYGNGGSILQNAQVHPFTAAAGDVFTFAVTVYPQYVPTGWSHLLWLNLFVTTCPGATANTSLSCSSPYPFLTANHTFPSNTTQSQTITFSLQLTGNNLWWWQMAAVARNTTGGLAFIFLNVGNSYGSVQGPVTGDFVSTLGVVIPGLYLSMFFYPGLVFYFALLVYMLFKGRERRRKLEAAQAEGPPKDSEIIPAQRSSAPATGGSPASAAERSCPNCQAVVYENESTCWKCGATLASVSSPPLSSTK